MAEVEKKDNFWLYIGLVIASIVVLAVLLKKDETKHLEMKGATVSEQAAKAALEKTKKLNNVFVE
jgi:hypothetical protein